MSEPKRLAVCGAMLPQLLAFLSVVLLVLVRRIDADSIQGCGGFVEASASLAKLRKPSDPKLDYSHMTVELHTVDGLIKDRTQCAPNGYYYLPVYDRGTFAVKIRGPDGWYFEPTRAVVSVDANGCNNNEDINFRYTGFTLSGKVLSKGRLEGPAGVSISLAPVNEIEGGPGVLTTVTSRGGNYDFPNLPSGEYLISAIHPKWDVQLKGSPKVKVSWDNTVLDDIIFISGYDVEGSVASQGNPVLGVQVYIYSDDIAGMPCPQGPGTSSPLPKQALCHAVSNDEGKFAFSAVPCGKYTLVPFYRGENTIFDVSPSSIDVTVNHDSVKIAKPFQVTGFSIGGRVLDTRGAGVEGVKILIDDVERARTDTLGLYKLDQVTSTQYTIRAIKSSYKFTSLENFKVLPNMASLPDIVATLYAVCGTVNVVSREHLGRHQVALTHGPVKPQTKRTSEEGSFCFEVPPGEYRLSPLTTPAESAASLLFTPPYLDISVESPVLDATFSEAQVSVSGVVKFKGAFSPLVVVTINPVGSGDTSRKQSTKVVADGGAFTFQKVLPGKYRLEVRHEPVTEGVTWDDDWSWEQKTLDLDVGVSDVTGLTFVQKGFLHRIKSTHDASAFTLKEHKDAIPIQIRKGWQEITLESPGVHELGFLWPCLYFGALSFQLDTSNPKPLYLVGQKYVLTGYINIDSRLEVDANSFGDSMFVDVTQDDGLVHEVGVHLVSEANATHPITVFKYAHWAQLGDKLIFSPRHARTSVGPGHLDGRQVLFYPKGQKVHVEADSCQPEIPLFVGRPGVYVSGRVEPPLTGVKVTVISEGESKAGGLKPGAVILSTATTEDGTFSAGPLYDDTKYIVEAAKEGFYLKSIGDNVFSVKKLGQIVVKTLHGEGAEESLPAILLSLSGDDGYRKNAITEHSGEFIFDNLFPGSFYLRPVLKEYSFSPPAQAIEVGSGEVHDLAFKAKRVAYSVHGQVTSLAGKPEEGVLLEARSDAGYYEETTTDGEGKYRLRGLIPNITYTIMTVMKNNRPLRIERASPASVEVKIEEKDTIEVDFVVFEESSTTVLTGTVEGADLEKWQPDITIEVETTAEPKRIWQSVSLPLSYFFEIHDLPKGVYNVRLVLGQQTRTHKFLSDSVEVDMESASQVNIGPLTFKAEEYLHSQELAPAPILPVVVGVSVILVFTSLPRLRDAYQSMIGSSASSGSTTSKPKVETRKGVSRTKRAF